MLENNHEKLLIMMLFLSQKYQLIYRLMRQLIRLGMDEHKGKDHTLLIIQRQSRQKDPKRANNRVLVAKAI